MVFYRQHNNQPLARHKSHTLNEIRHFFKAYTELQEKKINIKEGGGRPANINTVKKSFALYDEKYPTS